MSRNRFITRRFPTSTKHERGQAMLEFALILPIIVAILLGIFRYGILLAADLTLQSASAHIARSVTLHGTASDSNTIRAMADSAIQPLLDPSKLSAPNVETNYDDGTGRNDAVRVTLTYNMSILFPLVVPQSQNGSLALTRVTIMR